MSIINKICLYAGNTYRLQAGWELCDGNNGTPNIEPFVYETYTYSDGGVDNYTMPYLCCVSDEVNGRPSADSFIGQVIPFAGDFAPKNWAFCDGAIMDIGKNTALFSLLGTNYGGDGMRTFALPKIKEIPNPRNASNPPIRYIICTVGVFPYRED